jgi:hypothetical protein
LKTQSNLGVGDGLTRSELDNHSFNRSAGLLRRNSNPHRKRSQNHQEDVHDSVLYSTIAFD